MGELQHQHLKERLEKITIIKLDDAVYVKSIGE